MIRFMLLASILCCILAVGFGCGSPTPPANKPAPVTQKNPPAEKEGHSHGTGPHGGTVADWGGGKYHVEFTVDHNKQEATVYVLGSDGKTPASVKAEQLSLSIADPTIDAVLTAQPLEGEPEGTSSRFVGKHENLGKVQEYEGTISGEIDGTPYSGDFKEEAAK